MSNLRSRVIDNIRSAFESLPQKGTSQQFKHLHYFSNIVAEHIQGYAQTNDTANKYLFTHHTEGDYGYLLISKSPDDQNTTTIKLEKGCNHPGGIQTIGQYVFIPCEHKSDATILIYDVNTESKVKSINVNHKAGCIGITSYYDENSAKKDKDNTEDKSHNKYVIVIGEDALYHVYVADIPEKMEDLEIVKIGSFELNKELIFKEVKGNKDGKTRNKEIECQGLGLVTSHPYDGSNDEVEVPYLIAPVRQNGEDWIYLIELTIGTTDTTDTTDTKEQQVSITSRICRHLKSVGGVVGDSGTHFRWGAGVGVTSDNKLQILATSRNIISGGVTRLDTNYWISE